MWEFINKDPLIRTIVIIILGLVVFGLVFNIMFGGGVMGEMNSNYSAYYTFSLFIKLVIITAFIVGAVKLYRYIDNQIIAGKTDKWFKENAQNQSGRTLLIFWGSVAAFVLAFAVLPGMFFSRGPVIAYYNSYPGMQGNMIGAYGILAILAKILLFVSGISFVIAMIAYVSNRVWTMETTQKNECSSQTQSNICGKCGFALQSNWKCCPKCGYDISENEVEQAVPEEVVERIYQDDKNTQNKRKQKSKKRSIDNIDNGEL